MSKIYRVKSTINGHVDRYVRANNRQAAVGFVARDTLVANLATQDELVLVKPENVEDASSPQLDFVDELENSLNRGSKPSPPNMDIYNDHATAGRPITATEVLASQAAAAERGRRIDRVVYDEAQVSDDGKNWGQSMAALEGQVVDAEWPDTDTAVCGDGATQ